MAPFETSLTTFILIGLSHDIRASSWQSWHNILVILLLALEIRISRNVDYQMFQPVLDQYQSKECLYSEVPLKANEPSAAYDII